MVPAIRAFSACADTEPASSGKEPVLVSGCYFFYLKNQRVTSDNEAVKKKSEVFQLPRFGHTFPQKLVRD